MIKLGLVICEPVLAVTSHACEFNFFFYWNDKYILKHICKLHHDNKQTKKIYLL